MNIIIRIIVEERWEISGLRGKILYRCCWFFEGVICDDIGIFEEIFYKCKKKYYFKNIVYINYDKMKMSLKILYEVF